ncbi:MAG: hypothetical protein WBD40_18735 [Tepidisphaeraceae bacterium]
MSFGKVHVFYSEASDEVCTAALMLDVDPVGLVRNGRGPAGEGFALEQYVNDRPYVASSFLSVAIAQVFGSALSGTSRERPELTTTPIPLTARITVLPCRGGEGLLRRLFEPLGYHVSATRHTLDERFPEWGESPYYAVELRHTISLRDLLTHLYVLMPVLDNDQRRYEGRGTRGGIETCPVQRERQHASDDAAKRDHPDPAHRDRERDQVVVRPVVRPAQVLPQRDAGEANGAESRAQHHPGSEFAGEDAPSVAGPQLGQRQRAHDQRGPERGSKR